MATWSSTGTWRSRFTPNGLAVKARTRRISSRKTGRLAGAGTGDQADHIRPGFAEAIAQGAGDDVVVLQDVLPNLDQARQRAHDSISRAATSSSRPWMTAGVGLPQAGQQSC